MHGHRNIKLLPKCCNEHVFCQADGTTGISVRRRLVMDYWDWVCVFRVDGN